MKPVISIIANLDEPMLLQTVIETMATRYVDMGFSRTLVPTDLKALDTSGLEAYVSGNFEIQANTGTPAKMMTIPFTGCFLFTCVKGKEEDFNLAWSASLS